MQYLKVLQRLFGNLSSVLIPVLVTGMRTAPRLRRGKRSFQPKDLVWLDSCDEHRNEGPGMCGYYIEAKRDAVYGRDPGPVVSPRYLHGL